MEGPTHHLPMGTLPEAQMAEVLTAMYRFGQMMVQNQTSIAMGALHQAVTHMAESVRYFKEGVNEYLPHGETLRRQVYQGTTLNPSVAGDPVPQEPPQQDHPQEQPTQEYVEESPRNPTA